MTTEPPNVVVVDGLHAVETTPSRPVVYDRDIETRLLYRAPGGAEHYVVRYPPGLRARAHRHTAAHTIVVLEGRLAVDDDVVGPGAYCHFPAGETMFHAPAGDEPCLFVILFDGPFDVEAVDDEFRPGEP